MAHSTSRAARQDAEALIRKAKIRLPATPDLVEPVYPLLQCSLCQGHALVTSLLSPSITTLCHI